MDTETAAYIVSNSRFRPGWKFKAQVWNYREIMVTVTLDTHDTRYRTPRGTLTKPISMDSPPFFIDVTHLDESGLAYKILKDIVKPIDDHEDREFLVFRQPDGTWESPVHPHTPEGQVSWARAILSTV